MIGGAFGVTAAQVVTSRYPSYTGPYDVSAVASLSEASGVLEMRAVLSGLEASSVGGIHIHSGFTCSADDSITGGHCARNAAHMCTIVSLCFV